MLKRSQSFSSLQNKACDDDEAEEDDGDDVIQEYQRHEEYSILRWSAYKNKKPMVNFASACVLLGTPEGCIETIKKYHLGFKIVKTECKLVRNIFLSHGFKENHPNSTEFNVMWTGGHLRPYTLRALTEFQKVNHFPRSYELTRKDRLYKNISRMQHVKGLKHFDFVPQSFVLPSELNDFYTAFLKDKGPWIVKPVASSRGRGIYLINHINQIPLDDNVMVCKYVSNPLLINGFKFDCRIYVAVTSYDPLRIYVYEEGLARFSTVRYEKAKGNIHNQWMHLTNYSVNKYSDDYIRCDDPEVDDYGSKWSFSAMLRCLKENGKDTEALMSKIEDVIIKTIISGEMVIATACKMFVPYRGNCFELFGFDVLIDENLKPWILEVNLSPSLACESPLDLKIKANLISDLFNLTGVIADDPTMKKPSKLLSDAKRRQRRSSVTSSATDLNSLSTKAINKVNDGLTMDERRALRDTKEEYKRKGNFIRVYPSPESWELYGSLQEHQTSFNRVMHSQLYPALWRNADRPQSATYISRARNITSVTKSVLSDMNERSRNIHEQNIHQRYLQYERKLLSSNSVSNEEKSNQREVTTCAPLVQGELLVRKDGQSYENNLIEANDRIKCEPLDVKETIKMGRYLDKFQAREAFAIYLQRVQHRLLQEISHLGLASEKTMTKSDVEKQDQQMGLIHRFLMKAASNLSTPINISILNKDCLLSERKKLLASQLNDFIKVYTRETRLLSDRDGSCSDHRDESQNVTKYSITDDRFTMFLAVSSESELEEILTIYTRHNRSASIFLGAKPAKQSEQIKPIDDGLIAKIRKHNQDNQTPSLLPSRPMSRAQSGKSELKAASDYVSDKSLNKNHPLLRPLSREKPIEHHRRFRQHSSGSRKNYHENELHSRHLSADFAIRSLSAGSQRTSTSKQRHRTLSTVCAYTGANEILRYYQNQASTKLGSRPSPRSSRSSRPDSTCLYAKNIYGTDDPNLQEALRKLSVKQSQRTYSSNNIRLYRSSEKLNSQLHNDVMSDSSESSSKNNKHDRSFKHGDKLVRNSQAKYETEKLNYNRYLTSTHPIDSAVTRVRTHRQELCKEPHPPDRTTPVIKKQIPSQRMSRLVVRK